MSTDASAAEPNGSPAAQLRLFAEIAEPKDTLDSTAGSARRRSNAQSRRSSRKPVYRATNPLEALAIKAIAFGPVNYVPGSMPKRFARNMQGATEITDAQANWLWRQVWMFRRQIHDAELLEIARKYVAPSHYN